MDAEHHGKPPSSLNLQQQTKGVVQWHLSQIHKKDLLKRKVSNLTFKPKEGVKKAFAS